ncbi:hypothetical protein SAMN02787142_0559 [Burkholderia sp. WP9]|nr:hypothetical protein SAMN02787142_0559 [Burkholderia sp. WP9]
MPDGVITIGAAVIAASGALAVAYASNFLAEQYRRHLDSTSWAAALAGELESHASAFKLLKASLHGLVFTVKKKEPLPLYSMPMPTDPMFDSNPAKVGVLGPELAGECAYAYEQLRAFRTGMHVLAEHHEKMDPDRIVLRLQYLLQVIERNEGRLSALIQALYAYSGVPFVNTQAMGWWRKLRQVSKRPA